MNNRLPALWDDARPDLVIMMRLLVFKNRLMVNVQHLHVRNFPDAAMKGIV